MYNVALIGCGRISFKHIEGFVDNAKIIKLTAVCDPVKKKADENNKLIKNAYECFRNR